MRVGKAYSKSFNSKLCKILSTAILLIISKNKSLIGPLYKCNWEGNIENVLIHFRNDDEQTKQPLIYLAYFSLVR